MRVGSRESSELLPELLHTQPELYIVLTELSLRGLREAVINKMEKTRDNFWRDHLSGIIGRGVERGRFARVLIKKQLSLR